MTKFKKIPHLPVRYLDVTSRISMCWKLICIIHGEAINIIASEVVFSLDGVKSPV